MQKPTVYPSRSIGDLTVFVAGLKERPELVSITFDDGFNYDDQADFRVYMHLEPPEVMEHIHKQEYPDIYWTVKNALIDCWWFYDLILTWDEEVLERCPNAVLFPQALCTWIDKCYLPFCKEGTQETDEDCYRDNNNLCADVPGKLS